MFNFDMFLDCLTQFIFDLIKSLYVLSVITKNQELPDGTKFLGMLPETSLFKFILFEKKT